MFHSKLLQMFRLLSAEDLRQVQKMLKSPYFTNNQNLISLFKLLRSKHPNFEEKSVEKEKVFARIFPAHSFSDGKLRNLMTELRKLLEQHLMLKQLESDNYSQQKLLAKAFLTKGNTDLGNKALEQLYKSCSSDYALNSHDYYNRYEILKLRKEAVQSNDPVLTSTLIQEALHNLHHFFHFTKTKQEVELKNLGQFSAIPSNNINTTELQTNISFQLYQKANTLIELNDLPLYENLKKQLFKHLNHIDPNVQIDIFTLLINFTIKQMAVDDQKYNTFTFQLYHLGIEHQLFINHPQLTEAHFYNIVATATKENEISWAKGFIQSHKELLSSDTKEDLNHLSLAYLCFHQNKYKDAIDLLIQHRFVISAFKNIAKIQLIKCYFELFTTDRSYYDLLLAQTHSYEKFSRRNSEISILRKETQIAFTQFVRKLAQNMTVGSLSKKSKIQLSQLLEKQNNIISRSWLISKLEIKS